VLQQLLARVVQEQRRGPVHHGHRRGLLLGAATPHEPSSARGGKRPSGAPLPSQFSRLTFALREAGSATVSVVCRAWSIWKFSTATGSANPGPDPSPNGPEPPMPGP